MKEAMPGMWPPGSPVTAEEPNDNIVSNDGGDYTDKKQPQIQLSRPSGGQVALSNNFNNSAGIKSVVDPNNMTAKS